MVFIVPSNISTVSLSNLVTNCGCFVAVMGFHITSKYIAVKKFFFFLVLLNLFFYLFIFIFTHNQLKINQSACTVEIKIVNKEAVRYYMSVHGRRTFKERRNFKDSSRTSPLGKSRCKKDVRPCSK